ncbi:MAG TPA: hypothetical protein VKF39_02515 [Nitrososphaerales archaeon]|nr:hypothetical protein [Nitrososphaerales archaeon]
MKPRSKERLVYVALLAVMIIGIPTLWIELTPRPSAPSGTCSSSFVPSSLSNLYRSGYTPNCGVGSATDGRLNIIVHNYHFSQARDINFSFGPRELGPPPNDIFLLLNVTVVNVGGGNASIVTDWAAAMWNGTGYSGTASNFAANATFSHTYPNRVIPDSTSPSLYVPAGSRVDFWVFLYIPYGPNPTNSDFDQVKAWSLRYVAYEQPGYGGIYEGGGAYACNLGVPCLDIYQEYLIKMP